MEEKCWIKDIWIESNVFIGANATILPGSTIGNNSIIGAASVVKGKIPENSIVIGNPAKIVGKTSEWIEKKRNNNDYI